MSAQAHGRMCEHNTVGFCPQCAEWMMAPNPIPLAGPRVVFHGPQFSPGFEISTPTPVQKGWLCPRCETVNAPWMPKCDCKEATSGGDLNKQLQRQSDADVLEGK